MCYIRLAVIEIIIIITIIIITVAHLKGNLKYIIMPENFFFR